VKRRLWHLNSLFFKAQDCGTHIHCHLVKTQLQLIIIIIIINIIIIIIGKDTISFMQGIYTYIPETNHVPKQYSIAAILSLLFMVLISLAPALALIHFYIRTFRSMRAVPNIAAFCSSLIYSLLLLLLLLLLLY
jgi:hypothetical protein